MKATDKLNYCKEILQKKESIKEEKKGASNEINSIRLNIRQAIMDEDDSMNLKQLLQTEIAKEGFRKHLNSKINELNAKLNDIIMGTGDFNPDQLDLFDLESVKEEYKNMPEEDKKKKAKEDAEDEEN